MTRDLIFFNFQLSIQQWNIMGVNKKVEKCDRYITCNSEDSSGCCWSNLMIVPDEGSSRHGEGYYPGLSRSESLVTFSPRMLGWSLGGRERHDGQVTMSRARTQLSSDHRCYNFSWQPVESGEAWDRWPVHTGRPGAGHYSHDAGSASQGKHTSSSE